jgi:prolyl 4-hydroxylase
MDRAHRFLGFYDFDEIESPQLTRYQVGQEYQAHFDWPPEPWRESSRNNQRFERFSTFFVYLEANCTGGATHFPRVSTEGVDKAKADPAKYEFVPVPTEPEWTHNESLAARPVKGNAVFWVNYAEVGRGHPATKHAGMPVHDGTKIGLNIWTRRYLPEDEGMTKETEA